MFIRRGVSRGPSIGAANVSFALGVMLFGMVAAPFCRCTCAGHAAAAAAAPSCHHHSAHHGRTSRAASHGCGHADRSAVLPPATGLAQPGSAPALAGAGPTPLALRIDPAHTLMRPGTDHDIGPPVPASRFTVLRP